MKEATGELNMTVVTVVAIAALVAIFYMFIWPTIQVGMALSAACSAANMQEYTTEAANGSIECGPGKVGSSFGCVFKKSDAGTSRIVLGSGSRACD